MEKPITAIAIPCEKCKKESVCKYSNELKADILEVQKYNKRAYVFKASCFYADMMEVVFR